MLDPLRKTVLASLGIVSFTKEKLSRTIDELIEHGEVSREQGRTVLDTLLKRGASEPNELVDRMRAEVERVLGKGPFVTHAELRSIEARLDALEAWRTGGSSAEGARFDGARSDAAAAGAAGTSSEAAI